MRLQLAEGRMMPGRLEGIAPRWAKCSICGGVDLLSIGFIHHRAECPRSPCQFCGLVILPGETRETFHGRTAHLDCRIDWEHEEDHAEERHQEQRRG